MLNIEKENESLIKLELNGQLDSNEMEIGLSQLIEETQNMKNGKMLYIIEDFEIPTMGALMVEFSKLPSLFSILSRIDKAAVIADQTWLRKVAEWEGYLFPGLEIKAFKKQDEKEARAWLSN